MCAARACALPEHARRGWIRRRVGSDELHDLARDPGECPDLPEADRITPEVDAADTRLDAVLESVSL
ncbi:MAG: hypothetical protein E2O39_15630 [Planctomycetota bacterium]|nr:MAG: hypothetical protein E2O39_15630 [Planctomycetota bacterium]